MHGFASLVLDGRPGLQTKAQRTEALAAVLDFLIAGLCDRRFGAMRPDGSDRGTSTPHWSLAFIGSGSAHDASTSAPMRVPSHFR